MHEDLGSMLIATIIHKKKHYGNERRMSVPSGVEDMFIFRNKNISGENVSTSRGNTVG